MSRDNKLTEVVELLPPAELHPPLRSFSEVQAEAYGHCEHYMVKDDTGPLRFCRTKFVCAKGCGYEQEF